MDYVQLSLDLFFLSEILRNLDIFKKNWKKQFLKKENQIEFDGIWGIWCWSLMDDVIFLKYDFFFSKWKRLDRKQNH